jgi:putative ATP-binding cassette transporter
MNHFFQNELFKILKDFGGLGLKRILQVAGMVGLSSTLLVALVNSAAKQVSEQQSTTLSFFLFVPLLVIYVVLMRINNSENISSTQIVVHRFRMHAMSQVLKADVLTLDKIDRSYILSALNRDAESISMGLVMLVPLFQSAAMTIFSFVYLAFISVPAALATMLFGAILFFVSVHHMKIKHQAFEVAWAEQAKVSSQMSEFLDGFTELKMNSQRAFDISSDLIATSRHVTNVKSHALIGMADHFAIVQVFFYGLVGVMIFIVPHFSDSFYVQIVSVSTTVLFLAGSLNGLIQTIPGVTQANTAAIEIAKLNEKLAKINNVVVEDQTSLDAGSLQSIKLESIVYQFAKQSTEKQFSIGPVSYEFQAGKVYFIRGTNGSGKTSLVRLLIGLVPLDSGQIYVNDEPINAFHSQQYRDQFSTIFNDFHLFKKLYGILQASDEEVNTWLEKLEVSSKVNCQDSEFNTLSLSTGQKKRVALAVAMLEKRPVIILDEWASDQDPEFRRFFYEIIIPELRALNKLVIAITHDDNYFDRADHLLLVDNGKLYEDAKR